MSRSMLGALGRRGAGEGVCAQIVRSASRLRYPARIGCPCASLLSFAVVTDSFDPVAYNRAAWDREVENSNEWTQPVGPEVIARARAGDWSVVLIGYQAVPRGWFPAELAGAGGGGPGAPGGGDGPG